MPYPVRSGALAALAMAVGLNIAVAPVSTSLAKDNRPDPQAGARTTAVVGKGTAQKPPLQLTDPQKQQILQAVAGRNTLDKLPQGFTPQVGAKVPSQKKLPLHPLPAELVQKLPALKQYDYAKLEHNVLIVDPMKKQVVEVIPQ